MISRLLPLVASILVVACVPQSHFSTEGTQSNTESTTTSTTTAAVSGSSCADFSGFTSLVLCKQSTFAQCYPSTKIINGQTAVCYLPLTGWEQCAANPAQWSYGAWGNWCAESPGVFIRTRTATCQRAISVCDCITDAFATERCPSSNCTISGGLGATACSATPTPAPTPTPVPTPSWCNNVVLNYQLTDGSSESLLQDIVSKKYSDIFNYFNGRGYKIIYTRSPSRSLAAGGEITNDLISNHYVIQVEARKSGCTIGSHAYVTFRILKNGAAISIGDGDAGCVSLSGLAATATQRALDNLNAPNCR